MATPTINPAGSTNSLPLLSPFCEPHWYAVYTIANHEKRVAGHLASKLIEHFLPLYDTVRRWKDRRVRLQRPLFDGYVFVRIALPDRSHVLQVPGVVKLVGCNGQPTALADAEIEGLRKALTVGVRAEPHPRLTVGRRVQISSGPLEGRQGILLRKKGSVRVVLSIDLIMRSIVVDVDVADVEPAGGP
jgi:transcription antitermination factor NusG